MNDLELIEPGAGLALHTAEIDQQVATARRYPRSVPKFQSDAAFLATIDEETAMECIYALKRDGKAIEGASVRFAELVASCWGNNRFGATIIDEGEEFITARGFFQDLERNTAISTDIKRRIVTREGKRYGADMIGVTANAAMSIAMRNAILKGIPGPAWRPIYTKCRAVIAGSFETLSARRAKALAAFARLGATEEDVLQLLGRSKVEEIEPEDMVIMRGTITAIRDGDTTASQVFGRRLDGIQQAARRAKEGEKADIAGALKKGRGADEQGKKSAAAEPEEPAPATAPVEDRSSPDSDDAARRGSDGEVPGGDREGDGDAARMAPEVEREPGDEPPEEEAEGADEISPEIAALIPDGEWSDRALVKLRRFAQALAGAGKLAEVSEVQAEHAPHFETEGTPVEKAARGMVAARNAQIREARRKAN